MASSTATVAGFVTGETLDHYARLGKAMPGLLIVEYTYVHIEGRSEENQLAIDNDEQVEGLIQLANSIKSQGILAGIQLTHAGGKSSRDMTFGKLWGPSSIAVPVKGSSLEIPDPMNKAEIEVWKSAFNNAADRAIRAGFDLIELHSAHGYGLNQWLSPITNQRNDEYGKNLEGRMRLLLEIVVEIRRNHPQILISVRIPGQDFSDGGLTLEDSKKVALALEEKGVDIIHVSSGIGGWRNTTARSGEGYLVNEASAIQSVVNIPVIGVGGIVTGEYIDEGIEKGLFTLAAVGRAILADPGAWYENNIKEIS
jgi:NADPH2 dehydrogenase